MVVGRAGQEAGGLLGDYCKDQMRADGSSDQVAAMALVRSGGFPCVSHRLVCIPVELGRVGNSYTVHPGAFSLHLCQRARKADAFATWHWAVLSSCSRSLCPPPLKPL